MKYVTREEKLILQMKNIEAILTNQDAPAAQKVNLITNQMSYLNELVNHLIEPLREEAGDDPLVQLANDIFVPFIEPDVK